MNKKTKMWLGIGVVAAAAYYFWHKSQTPATTTTTTKQIVGFANAAGGCPTGYNQVQVSSGSICCDKPDCSGYNFRGKQVR